MAIAERAKSAALMESGAATSDTSRLPCNRVCKTAYSHELLRPEPGGGGTRDAWKVVNQPIAIIVRHWYGAVDWSIDCRPSLACRLWTRHRQSSFRQRPGPTVQSLIGNGTCSLIIVPRKMVTSRDITIHWLWNESPRTLAKYLYDSRGRLRWARMATLLVRFHTQFTRREAAINQDDGIFG